ncbi:Deleted in malignant brain tumors 1 [Paramuricea clavata]|uniref:Deleted in malignant brain tumors 1, partial n=1 Tax=Paramuricea clavata TaxID=317549 RepID=A0A7D9EYG9_PARCT|nr:Deleted in malignant brain tumors 1 [Paramuricea clavata]
MQLLSVLLIFAVIDKVYGAIPLRLQGRVSPSYGIGRVEVFYNDKWGTICDDRWDINDTKVVCHQLGYKYAVKALQGRDVLDGTGQIWLDDVSCTGSEQSLSSCSHMGWGIEDCSHSEDAGVICSSTSAKYFHLKPITNVPTRGNSTLDQNFNNLQDFYMAPNRRCPFGLSDHLTITVFPVIRQKSMSEKKTTIKVRDKRRSSVSLVLTGSPRTSRRKILYRQFNLLIDSTNPRTNNGSTTEPRPIKREEYNNQFNELNGNASENPIEVNPNSPSADVSIEDNNNTKTHHPTYAEKTANQTATKTNHQDPIKNNLSKKSEHTSKSVVSEVGQSPDDFIGEIVRNGNRRKCKRKSNPFLPQSKKYFPHLYLGFSKPPSRDSFV